MSRPLNLPPGGSDEGLRPRNDINFCLVAYPWQGDPGRLREGQDPPLRDFICTSYSLENRKMRKCLKLAYANIKYAHIDTENVEKQGSPIDF